MSWDKVIFTKLTTDATVGPLIDNGSIAVPRYRVFPAGEVPQGQTYPRITRQKIGYQPTYSNGDGTQSSRCNGLNVYVVQVDVWALTRAQAKLIGDRIRSDNCLGGLKGTVNSVEVDACFVEEARDGNDELPGQEKGPFRDSTDFQIWLRE